MLGSLGPVSYTHLEHFASVVMRAPQDTEAADELPTVYFDTLVGSDSHTPTANGIGVLGWGVEMCIRDRARASSPENFFPETEKSA